MSEDKVRTEEFKVTADGAVAKIKEIIAEGNVRRIIIQTEEGKSLIEFPLTVGVAAAARRPTSSPAVGSSWSAGCYCHRSHHRR